MKVNSAFCSICLKSVFLGSAKSTGLNLALFRNLHSSAPYASHVPFRPFQTYLGSHPASSNISTTAAPPSHSRLSSPLTNLTALCKHVSPSLLSVESISTPSWSRSTSSTSYEPYCAAMCRPPQPRASVAVLRNVASSAGEGKEERTSFKSSVLLRRQASRRSSRGEAPWSIVRFGTEGVGTAR